MPERNISSASFSRRRQIDNIKIERLQSPCLLRQASDSMFGYVRHVQRLTSQLKLRSKTLLDE